MKEKTEGIMTKETKEQLNISFPAGEIDVLEQRLLEYDPVLLKNLLKDKTTGENIKWGTSDYDCNGEAFGIDKDIEVELVTGEYAKLIQPRAAKSQEEQIKRTRDKAEVFTPSWVCNVQNNLIDAAWFGRTDVFNIEKEKEWEPISNKIEFPNVKGKTWQDYVEDTRLEIACGEAPYLVSRYDTVTGEILPIALRIGILDRKLRIVNENTETEDEWFEWAKVAFQHTYGFDFQGDNVLLARENLLYTFADYYIEKFQKEPDKEHLRKISRIVSWNIWQMDGITSECPFNYIEEPEQLTLDLGMFTEKQVTLNTRRIPCRIMDWKARKSITFESLKKENN